MRRLTYKLDADLNGRLLSEESSIEVLQGVLEIRAQFFEDNECLTFIRLSGCNEFYEAFTNGS